MLPLAGLLLPTIDLRLKAIDATLHALSQHQLVGFSEVHQSEECHAFLRDLIRSPKFSTRTIIVEFGNSRFQSTLDAYIAGKPVPRSQLQKVWRNTTQFLVWDSPVYERFFRTVRETNRHRKPSQKIRVLAGDPPVDWPNVHTAHDFDQYAKRDTFYFNLTDRIYRRKESALLIYGGMHLFKRDLFDGSNGQSRVEPLPELRARYGKDFYVIWTQFGQNRLFQPLVHPLYIELGQTALGAASSSFLLPENVAFFRTVNGKRETYKPDTSKMVRLSEAIDAILTISLRTTISNPDPRTYHDPAYFGELKRRSKILSDVFGMDFASWLEGLGPPKLHKASGNAAHRSPGVVSATPGIRIAFGSTPICGHKSATRYRGRAHRMCSRSTMSGDTRSVAVQAAKRRGGDADKSSPQGEPQASAGGVATRPAGDFGRLSGMRGGP